MNGEREFTLPVGLEAKGTINRKGVIRPSTAMDEIETQEEAGIRFNNRLRDIALLKRLVVKIGEISPVTEEDILNLYEADFIYLQILCEEIEKTNQSRHITVCPRCGQEHPFDIFNVFTDEEKMNSK